MTPLSRQRARGSVRATASWVAGFGEEIELPAPRAHRLADRRLAVLVTLGGVDDVEPGIERAAEQSLDRANRHPVVADLRAAEAQHAGDHAGPTKAAPLHGRRIPRRIRACRGRLTCPKRCSGPPPAKPARRTDDEARGGFRALDDDADPRRSEEH